MKEITYSRIEETKFLDFNFNNLSIYDLKINNNTDSNNQSITNNNMSYTDMMRYSLNICNTMKNNIQKKF